jgi:hypothetical protein
MILSVSVAVDKELSVTVNSITSSTLPNALVLHRGDPYGVHGQSHHEKIGNFNLRAYNGFGGITKP